MARRVLVTGGDGFVGRALVERFRAEGHAVASYDVASGGDVRDRAAVVAACAGMDTVIHNASLVHTKQNRADDVWAVNLGGTENVLEGCRAHAVARLVYVSSASVVYEGRDIENGDEALPHARISQAPYADSKIRAEQLALAFDGQGATRTCAIRPHVVFGAGDGRFVPAIVAKAREGKLTRAVGNREKLSDFTYIDNLVDAIVAAETRLVAGGAPCGQAYFVTNGEPIAFFDFVEKLVVALGYPPIRGSVPYWLAYSAAAVAEAIDTLKGGTLNAEGGLSRFAVRYMATHHYFDISKAKRDLQWAPQVSLDEGIRRTVAALGARTAQAA